MTIYLDYVFFINFLFDFILLLGISIVLKRNIKKINLLIGAIFGGLSTFMLFVPFEGVIFLLIKIIFGIIMLIITFGYKSIGYTFNNLVYLIILSIVLGGSLYLINIELGYNHTGIIFFTNGYSLNTIILILLSIFIIVLYSYINKKYKSEINNFYKVDLYVGNDILKLNGYLDTGNNLYDPYFNKPIIILNKDIGILNKKIIYVPFNTISGSDIMKCFMIDKIFISDIGFKYNVLIGLSNDKFHLGEADIILHKELIK